MARKRTSRRVDLERIKLTVAEGLALVNALATGIGTVPLAAAIVAALGPEKAATLITERKGVRLTKEEIVALVKEVYPLIPGSTVKDKLIWVVRTAEPAFDTQERYLAVIRYVKERIKLFATGQEYDGGTVVPGGTVSTERPSLTSHPYTITGYGPVNAWWLMSDETLVKIMTRMQQKNVRVFVVEAMGNAGEDVLGTPSKMAIVKKKYLLCVKTCDKLGLWFNPIDFNDNAGDGAYSNGGVKLEKRVAEAKAFIDWQAQQGYQHCTFVTPMAETQTSAGRSLQSYAAKVLGAAGFRLCTNDPSRAQSNASWSQEFCYHNTTTSDWPKSNRAYVLSDTGSAIRAGVRKAKRWQLSGGNLNGPGQADALRKWVAAGIARKQKIVAFYEFQYSQYNEAAIDAMAGPIGVSDVPTPTTGGDILPSQVRWLGPNYKNAKVTKQLTSVSISGNHLNFKLASPLGWPKSGSKNVDGIGFLIRKIGGEYVGGKVEWCVSSRGWYDIKTNVEDGYNGSTMPKSGETVWCGIGHPSSTSECTNLPKVVWP